MSRLVISAVVGSLRKGSLNRQLALEAKRLISKHAELVVLEYADVPFMNQDFEHPAPETVMRVRNEIATSDAVWFFTPEYNHFFPGVLKNLIDWLSRPYGGNNPQVLEGKPAAISGITPGMSGTVIAQDHLIALISFLNMKVMNKPRLAIPNAKQQTDENGRLALTASAPILENQANAFIQFITA